MFIYLFMILLPKMKKFKGVIKREGGRIREEQTEKLNNSWFQRKSWNPQGLPRVVTSMGEITRKIMPFKAIIES